MSILSLGEELDPHLTMGRTTSLLYVYKHWISSAILPAAESVLWRLSASYN